MTYLWSLLILWAREHPPSLINYFICRLSILSLLFLPNHVLDVNKSLDSECQPIIEVCDFTLLQFCLNPLGFDRLFIPGSWPALNKVVYNHTCFASYLRLRVGNVGGEYDYWLLEGNKCFTAGGFPSNPILFGPVLNRRVSFIKP